jgi:uncharacterized protein
MDSIIANNEKEKKFYLRLDGKEAFLKYYINGDKIDLKSTYVPEEFRGQEIGEALVKEALSYAENNNLKVIPTCPFVMDFIKENNEYKKLLA